MQRFLGPITLLGVVILGLVSPARAIIVLGGTDAAGVADGSGRNLNPAPGNLDNYLFQFGNVLGTPIAPQYFVTATHVGDGGSGGAFTYNNGTPIATKYTATLAGTDNDLAIWKLDDNQVFSLWAPLYTGSSEVGMSAVMIGRGTQRGTPVATADGQHLAGWNWGAGDGLLSWGTGTVEKIAMNPGSAFNGEFLQIPFTRTTDANGVVTDPNQGIFSGNDSGGATFVLTDQGYELAGVNSAVDLAHYPPPAGSTQEGGFNFAALYDARGYYDDNNQEITGPDPVPLNSYAIRISSELGYIDSVMTPEPASLSLAALGATLVLARRRR